MHHTLLSPHLPPLAQQGEQILRKHGIAIAPALATLDPQEHPLTVDIGDLQHGDLSDTEAGAIGDRECGLVFEASGGIEQPGNLVAAQYHRQVPRMRQPDKSARQVRTVERLGEEEA